MFHQDNTPKLMFGRDEFSPQSGFRLYVKSPTTQHEEDVSKNTRMLPPKDNNTDFGSKCLAVTQQNHGYNIMMTSAYVPRTPPMCVVQNSNNLNKSMKMIEPVRNMDQMTSMSTIESCPCCGQNLPQDKKLVNTSIHNTDRNKVYNTQQNRNPMPLLPLSQVVDKNSVGSNLMNSNQSENSYEEKKTDMKKKRRKRKNKAQIKELEEEFNRNPHWTNEDFDRIAKRLKLEKAKVYKWNWDQKKKMNILPKKVYVFNMPGGSNSRQIMVNSPQDLIKLQNQHKIVMKRDYAVLKHE